MKLLGKFPGLIFLVVSLIAVVLDQATKIWIINNLALYQDINVLPIFDITYVRNYGAAFSFLSDAGGWQRYFFTIIAIVISVPIPLMLPALVDEVLLDKKEDSERIKNLSTASSYKTESKGVDKVESFFFGKFILCSNNEENFIYVDDKEIRYWVLKVPSFKTEEPDLLEVLKNEIPFFVNFINKRKIISGKKTRMWFTKEQIHTEALNKLIKGKKSSLSSELKEILKDEFVKFEVDELKYSAGDLVQLLFKNNVRIRLSEVTEVLKNSFELESTNGSYSKYHLAIMPKDNTYITEKTTWKGRYYTFIKSELNSKEEC